MEERLLDPKLIEKVEPLDLKARYVVEGIVTGMHKSPYRGFNVEFAQYRQYVPGDDIKYLDWKAYAKTGKYYVKEYEEETNFIAHILVDASNSMKYASGKTSKFAYASIIAASLGYLILMQGDAACLGTFDTELRDYVEPSRRPAHIRRMAGILEETAAKNTSDVAHVLHEYAEKIKKKGIIILLSDLFDDVAKIQEALEHLRYKKHEVIVFHILDRDELDFPFKYGLKFQGLEETASLVADPPKIRKAYLDIFNGYLNQVKEICTRQAIDYVVVNTADPVELVLVRYLVQRLTR